MGLQDDIIEDAAELSADTELFAVPIVLTSPDSQTASLNGQRNRIGHKLDQSVGMVVDTTNATVTVHERNILAANPNYPLRNNNEIGDHYQKVDLQDHLVEVADSSGITRKYKVIRSKADETIGLIVLMLTPYEE